MHGREGHLRDLQQLPHITRRRDGGPDFYHGRRKIFNDLLHCNIGKSLGGIARRVNFGSGLPIGKSNEGVGRQIILAADAPFPISEPAGKWKGAGGGVPSDALTDAQM